MALPILVITAITSKDNDNLSIGGGDIKLIFALTCVFGLSEAYLILLLTLTTCIIFGFIYSIISKKNIKTVTLPLAPFILTSTLILFYYN